MNEFKRGEIYEYDVKGDTKAALVVGSDERAGDYFVSICLLVDESKSRWSVPVVCYGMKYASCNMVSYAHEERFGNYIRTASDKEMQEVDAAIMDALGLEAGGSVEELRKLELDNSNLRKAYNLVIEELNDERAKSKPGSQPVPANEDYIRAVAERDLYKKLY